MNQLGQTRSTRQPTHLLHTPDAFIRVPLPSITRGTAIIHASPALGAAFLWYTAELEALGTLAPAPHQRFVYILEGDATVIGPGIDQVVRPGSFAFHGPSEPFTLSATSALRCVVIEKKYEPVPGVPLPPTFAAREDSIPSQPLNGDPGLQVRELLTRPRLRNAPAPPFPFDFAVNTMTYAPGASLSQVEVHVMEHGCLMLEGGGIYRLADQWYPVQAGDFIWMAPYCPQWFAALGKTPAKYLIYKDFNRAPTL